MKVTMKFRVLPALLALALASCSAATSPIVTPVPGVVHGETLVHGRNHVDLYAQWWRPQQGPVRAVVVLVHGLKDHGGRYAAFAQGLTRLGFAVYAEDLRGHGRSGGERVWVDQFEEYVYDLARFVAGVKQREPGVPIFVLGHSMGGAIATLYALDHPKQIQGLVLSAPALQPGKDVSPALIAVTETLGEGVPHLPVLALDDRLFSHDPAVVDAMHTDPLVYDHDGPAHTAAQLLKALRRIQARAAELDVPLLDLHGTEDRITEPDGSRMLVKVAKAQDKTLKLYEGFYHDLLHEPDGARVAQDIQAWLVAHVK
jgi:acylglycerol lipase